MELKVKSHEIVVPGQPLAEGINYLPSVGTYRNGDQIYASKLGVVKIEGKVIKLLSLSGKYLPKRGDVIIGKVTDVNLSSWQVYTNSAYTAMLSVKDASSDFIRRGADLTKYFQVGDYICTKIYNVTSQNLVDLTMKGPGLRKLIGGRIMNVTASKVPRIIGKEGSMVTMIKQKTNCQIIVGQNGVVWIKGTPTDETLAVNTIRDIERQSHVSGLTDKIKSQLEKVK